MEQNRTRQKLRYQPLLPRLGQGHRQVFPFGVIGVDLDAIVGLRLAQPGLQKGLDVDTLPGARASIRVDLQRADPDPGAVALLGRLKARYLQEDGGDHVGGPQVNPELGTQDVPWLDPRAETKEAAGGELVLGDGIGWGMEVTRPCTWVEAMREEDLQDTSVGLAPPDFFFQLTFDTYHLL